MTTKKYLTKVFIAAGFLTVGWMFVRPSSGALKPNEVTQSASLEKNKVAPLKKVTPPRRLEIIAQNSAAVSSAELKSQISVLLDYKASSQKIFKLPNDEVKIEKLTKNYEKLQIIAKLLTTPELLSTLSLDAQDAAVDVLIKSLLTANPKQTEELVLAIINDGQIENSGVNQSVRMQMAAVKAELMYHAVSLDPQSVQNAISGPVTQKIWDNVQTVHASNSQSK